MMFAKISVVLCASVKNIGNFLQQYFNLAKRNHLESTPFDLSKEALLGLISNGGVEAVNGVVNILQRV